MQRQFVTFGICIDFFFFNIAKKKTVLEVRHFNYGCMDINFLLPFQQYEKMSTLLIFQLIKHLTILRFITNDHPPPETQTATIWK